jgi:hypothetical protein
MALTQLNQLSSAYKKLSGKAFTSPKFTAAQENIPSFIQLGSSTIFGETIPISPPTSLYETSSGAIVEKVRFELVTFSDGFYTPTNGTLSGTTIDEEGDSTTNGNHTWILKLSGSYQANSENPKKGTAPFIDGYYLTGSNGTLQVVPPSFGSTYNITLYNSSLTEIPPLDVIDWVLDTSTGVLFAQDAPGNSTPAFLDAYIYIGDYLSTVVSESAGGGGTGTGFPFSGSATITGSLLISSSGLTITGSGINILSGSINITNGGITSSLFGTASWANNATNATNATNAQTASYVNPLTQSVIISGGFEAIGVSGSRAYLGTHNIGFNTANLQGFTITGSGLIISSSNLPSDHYNFIKIGGVELLEYSASSPIGASTFYINNVDNFIVRSGSDGTNILNGKLLEHNGQSFYIYNENSTITINSSSVLIPSQYLTFRTEELPNIDNTDFVLTLPVSNKIAGTSNVYETSVSKFILTTGSAAGQIISGSGSLPALAISGGLSVNGDIIGSLLGTASWANNVVSASHALTASFINPTQFIIPEMGITGSGLIISASQPSGIANGIKIGNHEVLDLVNTFRINVSRSNADPTTLSDFTITGNNNTITGSIVNFSQNYFAFTERPGPVAELQGYYNFRANSTDFVVYKSESLNNDSTIAFDVSRVTGKLYASGGADLSGSTNIQNNLAVGGTLSAGASTLSSLTVTNLTTLNGNLVVNGTASFFGSASFVNVDNLLVEDKFILLNSGALGSPANEGGIIVQTTSSAGVAAGTALFYDQATNRWMAARSSSVNFNATSIDIGSTTDYVVTVSASNGAPSGTPTNFGGGVNDIYSVGQMYIQTDSSDIYIYA